MSPLYRRSDRKTENQEPQAPEILTRQQAAALLGISTRQLDRLPIPKSYAVGPRSPRYLRNDVIAFVADVASSPPNGDKGVRVSAPQLPVLRRRKEINWLRSRLDALE